MNKRQARLVRYCIEQAGDIARMKRKGMAVREFIAAVDYYMPKRKRVIFREALRREMNR